ncbi:MAG TPA: beta-ketoacyl-ACP synthase III [Candidatus Rifleibacterium sp.]|nr:beta-ketoacyl-ACP synthase III [Candidatus Rifleibacterium sp.]HPT45010.1 beta-ketoacyl-ACP synthase III [Candidatus Rifleibacterium sp.]
MKPNRKAVISGTGISLPERVLTNADLEKIVDTTDEWIITRTGIKERHQLEEGRSMVDLAVPACVQAIENAGLKPEEIDLIIFATFSPDYQVPSSACLLQPRIGCNRAAAFDLQAACTGFVYASTVACQFIATGMYNNILVVGGDVTTRILNFADRNSCVLFGDGVGATVFTPATGDDGAFDFMLGAIGSGAEHIIVPMSGSAYRPTIEGVEKGDHFLKINGKEVFKFSTKIVGDMIEEILKRNQITLDDIKIIIPHQANIRILESAAKRFDCPLDKFYINIQRYGNTVAASIPIALHEALQEGRIKQGDTVLFVGFGGGLTYGIMPMRWGSYTTPKV